jgi:hypothetical protein
MIFSHVEIKNLSRTEGSRRSALVERVVERLMTFRRAEKMIALAPGKNSHA